jgi:hypothetical protein
MIKLMSSISKMLHDMVACSRIPESQTTTQFSISMFNGIDVNNMLSIKTSNSFQELGNKICEGIAVLTYSLTKLLVII